MTDTSLDVLQWLNSVDGDHVHPALEVSTGKRGRGVFAKSPIASGELLASVPLTHCIGPFHQSATQVSAHARLH
jgi:hypothetical protein